MGSSSLFPPGDLLCPNWFRDKGHLRPCSRSLGHTKKCKFISIEGDDVTVPRNYTLLQGILRSGVSLDEVIDKYKLKINRSRRHQNLVQFKYDQIESDLSDPLVRQCRGIILDEADNWDIIARPFDKFFNYGETGAAEIDWNSARIQTKEDGTCCILYYYQGWHVATLGSCDASGPVGGFNYSFHDLFWATFTDMGYKVPDVMWSSVTFIFELTTPYNRVVVDHKKSSLKLLGARVANGNESILPAVGFQPVASHNLADLAAIQKSFDRIDPTVQEGYVVVDKDFNRIKIKHPGYVRIHHLKSNFTLRNIVECVRKGEALELINYFPEHADIVHRIKDSFFALEREIQDVWELTHKTQPQKAFAAEVSAFRFAGVLFAVRNGKKDSIIHALQEMHIDNLIELMEVKGEKETTAA